MDEITVAICAPIVGGGQLIIASVTADAIGEAIDAAKVISEEINVVGDYPIGRQRHMENLLAGMATRDFMEMWNQHGTDRRASR